jgi:hypothetical protein
VVVVVLLFVPPLPSLTLFFLFGISSSMNGFGRGPKSIFFERQFFVFDG